MKPDQIDGFISIIPGDTLDHYLVIVLEKGRVCLNLRQGNEHTSTESREDSAVTGEWLEIVVARDNEDVYMQVNGDEKKYLPSISETLRIQCNDNILIGALPNDIKVRNIFQH